MRYLRNVMGLWLLRESLRSWRDVSLDVDLDDLLREAATLPARAVADPPHDPAFLPSGDMPVRIAACRASRQSGPGGPAGDGGCIFDGLVLVYRRTVREAQELGGRDVDIVHVVSGGRRNQLLCPAPA